MRKLVRIDVCYVKNGRGERVDIDPRLKRKYKELGYKVIEDFEFKEIVCK